MHLSPDQVVFWQYRWFKLNLTIVTTWGLMALLTGLSWLATRRLGREDDARVAHWRSLLEWIVELIRGQMRETGLHPTEKFLGFIATLFIFVASANLCSIFPGYEPPTGSLSTTAALAICVFVAVPWFGIREQGLGRYLKDYLEPTPVMLPFNIISEMTRTLALAVRLFGNMMSDGMILGILLTITPYFFPVVMKLLGLLTGMVQAYIFSILATVYIAAAVGAHPDGARGPS
ncbi:MAG: F0F1 ATP synthase subunit A [Betaproteobacteria bacterium]|nr:F0F1 ATP synthase subunit A [Betaproteobacteria bacterium]